MRARAFLPAALLLAFSSPAWAGDTDDLEGLLEEPVVETASKSAERASAAPATSTTITAEDLRRFGIRSLDEALNFLSLGMVAENPRETVEVGARGVLLSRDFGNHVLLLLDGHTLNEPWGGTAYFDRGAAVPFELIDRIEVILGPGSVLYGSNAVLGVINIVTKRAKDYAGLHGIVESELPVSIRGAAGIGKTFKLFGKPAEITAQLEYYGSKGPNSSYGPQAYGLDSVTGKPKCFTTLPPAGGGSPCTGVWSSAGQPDLFFSQVPAGYARLTVGAFELSLHAGEFRRFNPFTAETDLAGTGNYEQDRWLSFDARYRASPTSRVALTTRLYGDLYDYREYVLDPAAEDCLDGQTRGCIYDLKGGSRWLGVEQQVAVDWLGDGRFTLLAGADARLRETYGSGGDYVDVRTGHVTKSAQFHAVEGQLGPYAEQTLRPTSWLAVSAGVRVDVDDRSDDTDDSKHKVFAHASPRFSVVASPWKGGHFKAIYAEAFRSPSSFERFYHDPLSALAAPDLNPEVARSVEASFEQRFGAHRLMVGVFRTWLEDLIISGNASPDEISAAQKNGQLAKSASAPIFQYDNASSVDDYGVNLAVDGVALSRKLYYGAGVTAAYARQNAVGEDDAGNKSKPVAVPLVAAAQVFGNARVAYDLGGSLPTLALVGRFTGSRPVAGSDFVPNPTAPPLVELRGTVSGNVPKVRGLSYRVTANGLVSGGAPYAVGPLSAPTATYRQQELVKLDPFRVGVGLEYVLPL